MKNSKIAINGFFGRMGQAIYELSLEQKFNVTLGVDKKEKLQSTLNLKLCDTLSKYPESFDVVIDFSLPEPCLNAVKECRILNKPMTIGTTGFNSSQKKLLIDASRDIPLLLAPNMSIGVNATLRSISELSKILSKYEVSIEETHHKNKLDSPSGTALKIAEVISKSRQSSISDIKIESYREDGEVGIHKTIFKSPDDEIILYHNAYNRKIFAQGALDTSQWISKQSSGFYTYENYLEDIS